MHLRAGCCYSLNYQIIEPFLADEILNNSQPSIYEVIRLHHGVPLFWDAHWIRFQYGINAIGLKVKFDKLKVEKALRNLIEENMFSSINIRIDAVDENILLYGIQSFYPSENDIQLGVDLNLTSTVRINPTIKFYRKQWREDRHSEINNAGVYETLLVNPEGMITEGSHSNVFFIKDQTLYSADESSILSGITRSEILKIAKTKNISVVYNQVFADNYWEYETAFLCGTSYNVLPVKQIEQKVYSIDHPLLNALKFSFDQHFLNEYLKGINKWKK
ncbi:MAG: aminotransferase class IV [Bacteroidales bacterium]|nr:aminotransferase class IV [Bacteroidales bacterium]